MASHRVPNSKYFRHRLYPRLRHGRKMTTFLGDVVTNLAASATGKTVVPKRTTNTKAEALITFGGNLSNGNILTIGNNTYTFKTALTEAAATQLLTNDATDVTAADTVTIDGVVYTFKSALTEAKAAGTFTVGGGGSVIQDGNTVTINGKVYTFQTSLTNVDGHVLIGANDTAALLNLKKAINLEATAGTNYAAATVLNPDVTAVSSNATTIVINAKLVGTAGNAITTIETSNGAWGGATLSGGVASVAREVLRGVSATASMTSLFEAITAGANAGVDYSTATTAHSTVTATNPSATTVRVTAKSAGTAGNSIAVSEASTHLSWGAATLAGGVASAANEVLVDDTAAHTRDNLVVAITAGAGAGTKYSGATVAHPLVTAAAATGDILITALLAAHLTPGYGVPISKTAANLTLPGTTLDGPYWTSTAHGFSDGEGPVLLTSSTTLPAGTPTTGLFVHKLSADALAFATSPEALRKGDFIQTTDAGTGTHTATRDVTAKGFYGMLGKNKPRTVNAASDVDSLL